MNTPKHDIFSLPLQNKTGTERKTTYICSLALHSPQLIYILIVGKLFQNRQERYNNRGFFVLSERRATITVFYWSLLSTKTWPLEEAVAIRVRVFSQWEPWNDLRSRT
jgi:hypothetical protein